MSRIAVVGLGLIGGSIALGIRELEPETRLVGVDVAAVIQRAEVRRLADELHDVSELGRALAGAELAILAMPVRAIESQVCEALEHAAVVTDCGSTKRSIAAAASRSSRAGRFVPGHPMAGGPERGADRARRDLFRGKRWLLCPERSDRDALERVESLVVALGADPVPVGIAAHDAAVALTSHVPQLLAAALLRSAVERGALAAAGPSFAAATRTASDNDAMWRDIFESNADAIADALAAVGGDLERARRALAQDPPDVSSVLALLAQARAARHS
jgi:prephenate dehydrogenase